MPHQAGTQKDNLNKRCSWNDGHGDISCGYFSVVVSSDDFVMSGNGWQKTHFYSCDNEWSSFTSPLPWIVDFHPGNICKTKIGNDIIDNAWIKYADDFVNMPTDTRCGWVGMFNGLRRCIIADKA
ncbi:hypothetical protein NM208_g4982 [Fusarium decemcellulare]|uniref:Uncharacterized protein n=1 Tax=Fusarium decemcellulare TaxID=57161 RepID=A0ACC1SIM3_9HYPO|nr:hypothetical protein NM208_g4982 [Fusarium decemcellulare]